MQVVGSLGTTLVVAVVFSWRLSIALLVMAPFMGVCSFSGSSATGAKTKKAQRALEEAGKVGNSFEWTESVNFTNKHT